MQGARKSGEKVRYNVVIVGECRKTGYLGPGTGESMGGKVSSVEVMQGRLLYRTKICILTLHGLGATRHA